MIHKYKVGVIAIDIIEIHKLELYGLHGISEDEKDVSIHES